MSFPRRQQQNGVTSPHIPVIIENGTAAESGTTAAIEKARMIEAKTRRTPGEWFKKYFWEGQKLHGLGETEKQFPLPVDATFDQRLFIKHKNLIALLIPFSVAQFIWWSSALKYNFFALYQTHWQMPATMVIGSIIAGMTSEGGGAVAFPVMIFILHTKPHTARDFSIMIQAVGMTMALFVILLMRIQIEWRAIIFGTIGAVPGALIGFTMIEPLFTPQAEKMLFVSIWSAFAISLWILNCEKKRQTSNSIENLRVWKCIALILTGFIGGIFTSFAGSGVDICTFSALTLLFSVSEKIATPTTVVIMAINSLFCVYWRAIIMDEPISQLAYNYIKVTAPVTSVCAPFGSFLGSHFHRQTLAWLVYILELISYLGFLFTGPPLQLVVASILIIAFGFGFFRLMSNWGKRLLAVTHRQQRACEGNDDEKEDMAMRRSGLQL